MAVPQLSQHSLSRADGSATFANNLYSILAAVNGPVEVQRRDELPAEAAVEVNIRPSSGIGGPRERWLESVVQSVLRSVLLVHLHPRTLIQVTLQVTKEPSLKMRKSTEDIAVIPSLVNAAYLALVDGGLPLSTAMTATLIVVASDGKQTNDPNVKQLSNSNSVHAIAHNRHGELLLNESSGKFSLEEWEEVADQAQKACMAAMAPISEDDSMINGNAESEPWLRQALEEKVREANAWREAT